MSYASVSKMLGGGSNSNENSTDSKSGSSHEDAAKTNKKLDTGASKFKNTTTAGTTTERRPMRLHRLVRRRPSITTMKPSSQSSTKKTIKPSITHTTIPAKELHQDSAVIGETTTAKTLSIDEFKESKNISSSDDLLSKKTSTSGTGKAASTKATANGSEKAATNGSDGSIDSTTLPVTWSSAKGVSGFDDFNKSASAA